MATIYVWLDDMVGVSGMYLFLRAAAGTLVNTGGDVLTDPDSSGLFRATVAESLTGLGTLRARVSTSSAESGVFASGWLPEGGDTVREELPVDAGGLTEEEQAQLDGMEATLATIATATSGGAVNLIGRVQGSTINAYIGDDYKVRSGTELSIDVADPASALFDRLDPLDLSDLTFGASRAGKTAGEITGTIASVTHSAGTTTIVVEITACGATLTPSECTYQIQSTQEHSGAYDDYVEVEGTLVLNRRTVAAIG